MAHSYEAIRSSLQTQATWCKPKIPSTSNCRHYYYSNFSFLLRRSFSGFHLSNLLHYGILPYLNFVLILNCCLIWVALAQQFNPYNYYLLCYTFLIISTKYLISNYVVIICRCLACIESCF